MKSCSFFCVVKQRLDFPRFSVVRCRSRFQTLTPPPHRLFLPQCFMDGGTNEVKLPTQRGHALYTVAGNSGRPPCSFPSGMNITIPWKGESLFGSISKRPG